jgi:hypothetical protein
MSMVRPTIRLVDPTARVRRRDKPMAPRPAELRGRRIGILDNTKSNADVLLLEVAALLRTRYGAGDVLHRRKAHAATGATEGLIDELAARSDVALLGSGD